MRLSIFLGVLFIIGMLSCKNQGSGGQSSEMPSQNQTETPNQKVLGTDPVCQMSVSDSTISAEHNGKKYYFCAEHCKEEFLKEPQKFLSEEKK